MLTRLLARWFPPAVLVAAALPGLEMLWRGRAIPRLSQMANAPRGQRTSVVVAARNEETTIRRGVTSLLHQDHPDFEVIVVDDRSTDGTAAVLGDLLNAYPRRLRVVTLEALPAGWLGKPHALWRGAQQASGEWLLFTDADVVLAPSCLRRAVEYATTAGLDHLTLGPGIQTRSFWLGAFVAFFTYLLTLSLRLYRVNDPTDRAAIGLGAFNLLRRDAYEAIGTYRAVALRPDDDVRLGQRVRQVGLRQQLLGGADLLAVEWYPSLRAAIVGLEKNFFAGYDYNVGAALASNALLLTAYVWPWLAVWRTGGWRRVLLIATLVSEIATFLHVRSQFGGRLRMSDLGYALVMPVSAVLVCVTALRSVVLTLVRGGIRWRDTFYPLSELS
jgi:glycosyltransferase involved in cell wall biosynthesis